MTPVARFSFFTSRIEQHEYVESMGGWSEGAELARLCCKSLASRCEEMHFRCATKAASGRRKKGGVNGSADKVEQI